jgi:hypothetical protein
VCALPDILGSLEPAPKIPAPQNFRPGVEFDGNEGTATTEGLPSQPNFDEFLRERGYPPEEYEVVGTPRTSQWQTYHGDWLTSYRFSFRKRNLAIDLPTLLREARKAKPIDTKPAGLEKALVICPADLQVGKVGSRGGSRELIARVYRSFTRIEAMAKQGKYEHIYILDLGDIIESVSNKASLNQLESNDLSPMQQVDLAASLMFDLIKRMVKFAPVTYGSIASNHCQNRMNGQQIGRPGLDDWGIVIAQQLRRLTTELEWKVNYLVPQPHDEGFAFQYGVNTVGVVHGHQVARPEGMEKWWEKQTFGNQWSAPCNLLLHGHFHHLRVTELGQHISGGSRYLVMAPTSDNGSDWFRLAGGGSDSTTGIMTFELERDALFTGTVRKF